MPFDSGSISLTICSLGGEMPEDAVSLFASKAGYSLDTVLDSPQIGWVSGRHLLETRIDDETAYAGGCLHLNLRSAQRKVPASLYKAEVRVEELAHMQAMECSYLPRKQKKEIREEVGERLLKDSPPTLTGTPFVVDTPNSLIYVGTTSQPAIERFRVMFYETIGFEPMPLTPESSAELLYKVDPNELPSVRFSSKAPAPDDDETVDIGRDFATWLWYFQEVEGGSFRLDELGYFNIMIDGPLVFAADGCGALETVVRKGLPTISPEAKAALLVGKKLKQAKFQIVRDEDIWQFTLDADMFGFRGLSLPDVDRKLDPASHIEERIRHLGMFYTVFFELFERYLKLVSDKNRLHSQTKKFDTWIAGIGAA